MGMGLGGDADTTVADGDAGRDDDMINVFVENNSSDLLTCSICLDVVAENGDRSWAKLQCGHHFHLDCIGSAFNVKGSMQCPNCRKIEKGQWLYGNGSGCQTLPDITMEEWLRDDDIPDLSYAEMAFGVHWCPYGSLNGVRPSFEESEFTHPAYHDLPGQHTMSNEHVAQLSVSHPCPYIAYIGPIHHPLYSNTQVSVSETSSIISHWNGPPTLDLNYQAWEQHSSPFFSSSYQTGGSEQPSVPPISQILARASSDVPRPGTLIHPYFMNHSSGLIGRSSSTSSMVPPYPGSNARARDRAQSLQAYYHQGRHNSSIILPSLSLNSANDRFNYHGAGSGQGMGPTPHDPSGQILLVHSGSSSGQNFQEVDAHRPSPIQSMQGRDRNFLFSFLLNDGDRDSGWGTSARVSDSGIRTGSFQQRPGSERMSMHDRSFPEWASTKFTSTEVIAHNLEKLKSLSRCREKDRGGGIGVFGCHGAEEAQYIKQCSCLETLAGEAGVELEQEPTLAQWGGLSWKEGRLTYSQSPLYFLCCREALTFVDGSCHFIKLLGFKDHRVMS